MFEPSKNYKVEDVFLHNDTKDRELALEKQMAQLAIRLQDLKLRKKN